jgi:hypothetical protein
MVEAGSSGGPGEVTLSRQGRRHSAYKLISMHRIDISLQRIQHGVHLALFPVLMRGGEVGGACTQQRYYYCYCCSHCLPPLMSLHQVTSGPFDDRWVGEAGLRCYLWRRGSNSNAKRPAVPRLGLFICARLRSTARPKRSRANPKSAALFRVQCRQRLQRQRARCARSRKIPVRLPHAGFLACFSGEPSGNV